MGEDEVGLARPHDVASIAPSAVSKAPVLYFVFDVMVLAGPGTSTSAIRGTQIQLKYLWEKSDYLLKATH